MIGDKSSYKETPCIDSPTDRCPGIYSYLSGAVRLLESRVTGNLKSTWTVTALGRSRPAADATREVVEGWLLDDLM
jgi:hypothetical protein